MNIQQHHQQPQQGPIPKQHQQPQQHQQLHHGPPPQQLQQGPPPHQPQQLQQPGGFYNPHPQQGGGPIPPGGFNQPPHHFGGPPQQGGYNRPPPHFGGPQQPGGFAQTPQAGGQPPYGGPNQLPHAAFPGGGPQPFPQGQGPNIFGPGQGPPFPQGGGAMGAVPNNWLGPRSAWYFNMNDPKQRRVVCGNITKRVQDDMKTTKYEGPPAQPSSSAILTARNDPVCFQDSVITAFSKESGGILTLPTDDMTYHPHTGVDIVHPRPDWLTTTRMEVLLDLLPNGLGTVAEYNTSTNQDMKIHDLRGGKRSVPQTHVTVMDFLRLFLEEEWRKHATKVAASTAFNSIQIRPQESWLAVAERVIQIYRASTVDPALPFLTEETYFWSQLSADQLELIQEKTIELCIPSTTDRAAKEALLQVQREYHGPRLEAMPVVKHLVGLQQMNERGALVKSIFKKFSQGLAKDAGKYLQPSQQPKTAEVNTLKSNKMPIHLAAQQLPTRTSADSRKPAAPLCAIGDADDNNTFEDNNGTFEDNSGIIDTSRVDFEGTFGNFDYPSGTSGTEQLMALAHPDGSTRKRQWTDQETSRAARPRRSIDDRPNAPRLSERQGTFSPGTRSTGNRSQGRKRAMPKAELPLDAPKPDSAPEEIKRYIFSKGVCISHARGLQCSNMVNQGCCPYSHAPQPVPWGAYPFSKGQQTNPNHHEKELLLLQIFISSRAQIMVMEAPARFTGIEVWRVTLAPQLQMAGCEVETATLKATSVGVPTNKQRVFVVAVKRYGDDNLGSKLQRWKQNVERSAPSIPTVGEYLGRAGSFFLKRGALHKEIFSFAEPTVTITKDHIMARKPPVEEYQAHLKDCGTLEEAQELSWTDCVKLTTTREDLVVPNTLRRRDVARVLDEWTLPPMLREVLSLLQLRGRERRMVEAFGEPAQKEEGQPQQEGELLIGLAALQLDATAPVGETSTGRQRPFDRSRFKVIPRETRAAAAARRTREAREAQASSEAEPPPPSTEPEQPSTPPPILQPSPSATEDLQRASTPAPQDPSPPIEPVPSSPPSPVNADPDTSMPDVELPTPAVDGGARKVSVPTFRGHSEQLEKMERILRDPVQLADEQQKDFMLGPIRKDLENGKSETSDYILDDQSLLFHAPRGKLHAIALPRRLIPGVLALAHGTFAHPGRARTTIIIAGKYHWPSLKKDVRRYVESCRCRMKKRQWSRQLRMLPARFLLPWQVLELDILDTKTVTALGNRYLLVVVDRATKFLFGFPLPTKETVGVSRKLLELILIFGLPLSIRCDPGRENTSEIMEHLCRWLKVSLDFGPANHPRGQGTVERMGAVLAQLLSELCQAWPQRWDEYVAIATWAHRMQPDESLPGNVSPYQMLFGRAPRTPLDQLSPSLDNSGSALGLESSVEETRRKHIEVTDALRKRQAEKNRHRDLQNARISRASPGAKSRVGDKVLVRESASTLHRDGVHPKLAHDHFTGPWVVVNVVRMGLSFTVRLHGRQVRQRTVVASDMKQFYSRPLDLRLPFEDEFSHFVWGPDLGLVEDSVVAAPLYTLVDRRTTQGAGGASTAWAWEYRGKYQDGTTSSWLTEDTVKDSFSPLQLDVFHALWEDYHGSDVAPRPPGAPTRGEREVATREAALQEFPLNTEVAKELRDKDDNIILSRGKVCDFYDPYWRVEFSDGDWEEFTRRELRHGIALASQIPPASQEA
ncbi:unnamed protein product [Ectocarpus sp. CCAP 1310/34]|nr:unnamed protein product [Ectocarpus sp. CCAP 1310/34]